MRIVALALAALLIVISGFWLARDRAANRQLGAAPTTSQSAAASGTQDQEATGLDAGEGAGDEADTGATSAVPEGFTVVEPLVEDQRRVFDAADQVIDEGVDYLAVIETNRGVMVFDLFEERTPVTVNNFVFLALNRYFDGVPFHRVIEGFMAQTGDPTGSGTGGPGYQFADEIVSDLVFDEAGLLAMANAGPGTNGSQFFITFEATPWLNGAHTIFGSQLSGSEVLPMITRVDPQNPSAAVPFDASLADLREQGVDLPGSPGTTVSEAVEDALGTLPVAGQSFTVAGYRGVVGQLGGTPAFGFFANPDTIESVIIASRPQ